MKKFAPTGLSLPLKLIHEIDIQREDVPRSRFILKLIQEAFNKNGDESSESIIR